MYYIDFDNTLYETGKLTKNILSRLATTISAQTGISKSTVLLDIQSSFNSTTDNFFTFAKKLSIKYKVSYASLETEINQIIIVKGKNYVFPDALQFLKKLHNSGETICILTYVAQVKNLNQQALKLTGSGLLNYVDEVYNTTRYKYELEIDYENGTFIDDSPRDIEGFYNTGARKIIRIIKPNNEKRTSKQLNLPEEIPTYTDFSKIALPEKPFAEKSIVE